MRALSDAEIDNLIRERKSVPSGLQPLGSMTMRHLHERREFKVTAQSGNEFVVALRRSTLNVLDFSVILGYQLPTLHTIFRLRRYNGKSHQHTNAFEKQTFYDFHLHTATERYQQPGFKEDHFAEVTNRYHNLETAIECLLNDCGFRTPIEATPLFLGQPI
jgi:hypothetical protein